MTDWTAVTARAGAAGHDLVGWIMWDAETIARYESLGVTPGATWILAWRLAPLGDISPAAAAAATYSVDPAVIEFVMSTYRGVTDTDAICSVRDESAVPGVEAKGLATDSAINDAGRRFRLDLERRTNELTAPTWQAVGEQTTRTFCEAIEAHDRAFVDRIDATAGPRWMPAARHVAGDTAAEGEQVP